MARRQHAGGGGVNGRGWGGLSRERRKETWTNKFPAQVYPDPSDGVKNVTVRVRKERTESAVSNTLPSVWLWGAGVREQIIN